MKSTVAIGILLTAGLAGQVQAQCSTGQVTGGAIFTTLQDKLACAYKTNAASPLDRWSEVHVDTTATGGTITEWARGPTDTVDPSHDDGATWDTDSTGNTVTYDYGGAQIYTYYLYSDGAGAYSLCNSQSGSGAVQATIQSLITSPSGTNPCTWSN
jgi:hypothetical protein